MKKLVIVLFALIIAFALSGCTQGTEQNLLTGQETAYTGLSYDSSTVTVDGISFNGTASRGQKITFLIKGLDGFVEEDGMVSPQQKLTVLENEQEISSLEDTKSFIKSEVNQALSQKITINSLFEEGKEYTLVWTIIDSKNEESKLTTQIKLKINQPEGFAYSSNGLEIKNDFIGVANEDNKIIISYPGIDKIKNSNELVFIYIQKIIGIEIDSDGIGNINAKLSVKNSDGEIMTSSEDLYGEDTSVTANEGILKDAYISIPISDYPSGRYIVEYTYIDLANNNSATKTRVFEIE